MEQQLREERGTVDHARCSAAACEKFKRGNFKRVRICGKIQDGNPFVVTKRVGHVRPVEKMLRPPQLLRGVLGEVVVFAPGQLLGSSFQRRAPPEKEEVMAAQSAAIGREQPVQRTLPAITSPNTSEIDRLAIGAVCGAHA